MLQLALLPWIYSCGFTPVDLSYGYDNNTISFPGGANFSFTEKRFQDIGNGIRVASFDFETAEHSGTHMDAPFHFDRNGATIDQIPLQKLFATGVLINATTETGNNASYVLPVTKLTDWERMNGKIPNNSFIFVNFGWGGKYYSNRTLYMGPSDDDLRHPGISDEAADWMIQAKVLGVGVDTLDPEIPNNVYIHINFLHSDMYIIENVNISVPLPPKFPVVLLPMKLIGGTAAPVRIIAFV